MTFLMLLLQTIETPEDSEFVERIWYEHRKYMLYEVYKVLHQKDKCEDIVNDLFGYIGENVQKFREIPEKNLRAYLCKSCKNRALNLYNSYKRQLEYESPLSEYIENTLSNSDELPEKIVINAEMLARVKQYINELDDLSRDIMLMAYWKGMSNTAIAELYGMTANNVNVRIHRAKLYIKDRAKEEGFVNVRKK